MLAGGPRKMFPPSNGLGRVSMNSVPLYRIPVYSGQVLVMGAPLEPLSFWVSKVSGQQAGVSRFKARIILACKATPLRTGPSI